MEQWSNGRWGWSKGIGKGVSLQPSYSVQRALAVGMYLVPCRAATQPCAQSRARSSISGRLVATL
jgi:hypothetical protein